MAISHGRSDKVRSIRPPDAGATSAASAVGSNGVARVESALTDIQGALADLRAERDRYREGLADITHPGTTRVAEALAVSQSDWLPEETQWRLSQALVDAIYACRGQLSPEEAKAAADADLEEALAGARAQRDRYREGLQKIAHGDYSGPSHERYAARVHTAQSVLLDIEENDTAAAETDGQEGRRTTLDPRVQAASDALGLAGHRPPDHVLEAAFADADAVDPVRAGDFAALIALCERIMECHYPATVFTGSSGDRGARFVAALREALTDLDLGTPADG